MNKLKTNNLAIADFKADNNSAFGILYEKYFELTKNFVLNNSGNLSDAEDIFQDAMMILFVKLSDENFKTYTCLSNYVMGISKNLWLKKLRNRKFYVEFPDEYYQTNQIEIDSAIENERDYLDKMADYVMQISTHCQNLITDIFYYQKNMDEIKEKYRYSSQHNAQNQRYKCVAQIRKAKERDDLKKNKK